MSTVFPDLVCRNVMRSVETQNKASNDKWSTKIPGFFSGIASVVSLSPCIFDCSPVFPLANVCRFDWVSVETASFFSSWSVSIRWKQNLFNHRSAPTISGYRFWSSPEPLHCKPWCEYADTYHSSPKIFRKGTFLGEILFKHQSISSLRIISLFSLSVCLIKQLH